MAVKFYRCNHCGNIIYKVFDSKVPVVCCGEKMTELVPGTSDGAVEKHVPAVTVEGKNVHVRIGSVDHPMVDVHYIQWVALETKKGVQIKYLNPEEAPAAEFVVAEDNEPVAVYEYCNLHGLWKAAC